MEQILSFLSAGDCPGIYVIGQRKIESCFSQSEGRYSFPDVIQVSVGYNRKRVNTAASRPGLRSAALQSSLRVY